MYFSHILSLWAKQNVFKEIQMVRTDVMDTVASKKIKKVNFIIIIVFHNNNSISSVICGLIFYIS